ncbi:NB-ARC domain-containing protein [Micromonospora ureilytica]|uniref:NB-ARC domain-containing protein n=1 Tax=Micromonospora ureilytica TaxID=709868 RepID=UPI0039903DE5
MLPIAAVVAANLTSFAINILSDGSGPMPYVLNLIVESPLLSVLILTIVGGLSVVFVNRTQRPATEGSGDPPAPPLQDPPGWVVGRPSEVEDVVRGLLKSDGNAVGITTALHGAGGFGKTTLATIVCSEKRIRRRFKNRIYQITLGRDLRSSESIAGRVNDAICLITGERTTYADPRLAGQHLGRALDARPRMLLLIDDVWNDDQIAPFLIGGARCERLITTRLPAVLPARATAIKVDQMSPAQARQLLTWELPPIEPKVLQGLLSATGRWPLLLRLVNRVLADELTHHRDASDVAAEVLRLLHDRGPAEVDLLSKDVRELDLNVPEQRSRAVRATIEASTKLLIGDGAQRLAELGVFAEDEAVPVDVISRLWASTAALSPLQTRSLCRRMINLALLNVASEGSDAVSMHDVVRDFLRAELGGAALRTLNDKFVDAIAARLPSVAHLDDKEGRQTQWWALDDADHYLWDHLVAHLIAANRILDAAELAANLRWAGERLIRFGSAAPYRDLSLISTSHVHQLRAELARASHLLQPTNPREALVDVLHSRLHDSLAWGKQVQALRHSFGRPRLINALPLPDLPHPAMRRTLVDHVGAVLGVVVSSGGDYFATAGEDGKVRLWDSSSGQSKVIFNGEAQSISKVSLAPNGSWIAIAGVDGVELRELENGQPLVQIRGQPGCFEHVACSPDSRWLVTAGSHPEALVWDATRGNLIRKLTGHAATVSAVAISPDGLWVVTSSGCTVRIWNARDGSLEASLNDHRGEVTRLAFSADSKWFASGGQAEAVKVWRAGSWTLHLNLSPHSSWVTMIGFAADGSWLASADQERVRLWDLTMDGKTVDLESSGSLAVALHASSDSRLLAAAGQDAVIRVWDAQKQNLVASLGGHSAGVTAVQFSPDATWMASTSRDGTIRTWDMQAVGTQEPIAAEAGLSTISFAAAGKWVVTTGKHGGAQIWDIATGRSSGTITHQVELPGERLRAARLRPAGPTRDAVVVNGLIATVGRGQSVRLWNEHARFQAELSFDKASNPNIQSLAADPNGVWLAAVDSERSVRVWNVSTGQFEAKNFDRVLGLKGASGGKVLVAVAHSCLIVSDGKGSLQVWDLPTEARRRAFGVLGQPRSISVSAGAEWAATSDGTEAVSLYRIDSSGSPATLQCGGPVTSTSFSDSGSHLVVVTGNGTLSVFSTITRTRVAFMRVDGSLTCSAWLPKSNNIAVGGLRGLYLFEYQEDT